MASSITRPQPSISPSSFSGYSQSKPAEIDREIAEVGPGTVCGEYLRRFWHPVFMTSDLDDMPKAIKILGEELVLFRYGDKTKIGLVHKYCPHRRASLEYGKCEANGIRCCYHGWLFAPDGEILETPGEDNDAKAANHLRASKRLGAYPVIEYKGLIFTYMGPPELVPEFPIYDTFEIEGMKMSPYKAPYKCNWIQVLDAIMDPVHTSFLHSQNSHPQFSDGMCELGELKFYERNENHFLGSSTRRVNDNAWVRLNELILPNFTQAGSAYTADGTKQHYFGRSAFTRWVVPVDDENSIAFAWANFGERGDPHEYDNQDGYEMIEQGEVLERSDLERQKFPADSEAVEGMGAISTHKGENLMPSDRGVTIYRQRIRRQIRELGKGQEPPQPLSIDGMTVRTYGQDTVLHMPKKEGPADRKFLAVIGEKVMAMEFEHEGKDDAARDASIIAELKNIEAEG
jgi:phenylpropionate dioxygenase-like ring-hydroxylating dioxygenase large terminal subunit